MHQFNASLQKFTRKWKMYENMPKTGISMSENTIIFHYEAYYSVI